MAVTRQARRLESTGMAVLRYRWMRPTALPAAPTAGTRIMLALPGIGMW